MRIPRRCVYKQVSTSHLEVKLIGANHEPWLVSVSCFVAVAGLECAAGGAFLAFFLSESSNSLPARHFSASTDRSVCFPVTFLTSRVVLYFGLVVLVRKGSILSFWSGDWAPCLSLSASTRLEATRGRAVLMLLTRRSGMDMIPEWSKRYHVRKRKSKQQIKTDTEGAKANQPGARRCGCDAMPCFPMVGRHSFTARRAGKQELRRLRASRASSFSLPQSNPPLPPPHPFHLLGIYSNSLISSVISPVFSQPAQYVHCPI